MKVKQKTMDHRLHKIPKIYRFEKTANGGMVTIKKTFTEIYKNENPNVSDTTIQRGLSVEKWSEVYEKNLNR